MNMKKVSLCGAAIMFAIFAFFSCKSAEPTAPVADSYGTETEIPLQQTQGTLIAPNTDGKRNVTVPQTGNAFTRFFTGDTKDIEMGVSQLSSKTVLGKLKLQDASAIYNIETGYAGFSAPYQTGEYHLLFDKATRDMFHAAVEQYLSDFENKTLERKTSRTYKIYGERPINLVWGTFTKQIVNHGTTKAQFGYEFRGGSPYFSITVPSAENDAFEDRRSNIQRSTVLHFYFTKAQAMQMSNMLTEESIDIALAPYTKTMDTVTGAPIGDEY